MNIYMKIGFVLALVSTGVAYSSVPVTPIDTSSGSYSGAQSIYPGDWAEGAFSISSSSCLSTCSLDNITLRLILEMGSSPSNLNFDVSILNGFNGSILSHFSELNPGILPFSFANTASLAVFVPTTAISLSSGSTYWVRLTENDPLSSSNVIDWAFNSGGSFTALEMGYQTSYSDFLKMTVNTTPLIQNPVPATAWLMGTALFGLIKLWHKKES